jgi:alkaline phosphatase
VKFTKFTEKFFLCVMVAVVVCSSMCVFSVLPKARVKNVILFIGDGMGFNHIQSAKIQSGQNTLAMEGLDTAAQNRTSSLSVGWPTDSAAGATAFACGQKVYNGNVGRMNGNDIKNISEYAIEAHKSVGIVTTDSITGATPAVFSSHVDDRSMESEIARQQSNSDIDLLMGAETRGNMTIREMTAYALDFLVAKQNTGFFLMVEAGLIDKHSHSGDIASMIAELLELDEAIKYAKEWATARGDTAIIVTADHETGGLEIGEGKPNNTWYTSPDHTAVNVPIFVFRVTLDANHFISNNTIDNTAVFILLATCLDLKISA